MKMAVEPCSLVETDRRFSDAYCLDRPDYVFCICEFCMVVRITSIISLNRNNQLIFVMLEWCVLFEARIEFFIVL
jgi:hypothetical protein